MEITEKELRKIIRESIHKKFKQLNESSDFTARREIILAAQDASMNFEKEIVSGLDLVTPDQMKPLVQDQYYEVVKNMENGIVKAVSEAIKKLGGFPRKSQLKDSRNPHQ